MMNVFYLILWMMSNKTSKSNFKPIFMKRLYRHLRNILLLWPILFATISLAQPVGWEVNPPDYSFDGTCTAEVFLDEVNIFGAGDYLAVFEDGECRGVQICAQNPLPFLDNWIFQMQLYGNSNNVEYTFKVYDASENTVYDISQTMVFTSNCSFGDLLEPLQLFMAIQHQQTIIIPAGWSGISSYVVPNDPDVEGIFASIVNELLILQNFEGMYWPDGDVNSLGNWDSHSGYQIKLQTAQEFTLSGVIQNNLIANLSAGWNYLPVLNTCDNPVEDLFSPIINHLQIVKEVAGPKVYWPQFGINTLDKIIPGKAYFVLVDADVEVEFPECRLTLTGASTQSSLDGLKN